MSKADYYVDDVRVAADHPGHIWEVAPVQCFRIEVTTGIGTEEYPGSVAYEWGTTDGKFLRCEEHGEVVA